MQFNSESPTQSVKEGRMLSHHRGWAFLEQGSILLLVLVGIGIILTMYTTISNNMKVANESSNIQSLMTASQNLLKASDGYSFSSGAKMMGALIQMKAQPKDMKVQGTVTSGNATLYNVWNGAVTLSPVSVSGFAGGFSLTYEKVPQSACVQLVTKLSRAAVADIITINSTAHSDGNVTTEEASAQCTADNGSSGTNKLIFTLNS
ncbi:pilus assembly protein PilX [Enterobacter sp. MW07]|nr:pilus assembly protein PilX [Enterobacter sp. MW07]